MNRNLALLFATAALVSACGGGNNDEPVPAPPTGGPPPPAVGMVPGSIGDSVAAYVGYLLALVPMATDDREALDVSAVTPPLSETAEPTALP